MAHPAYSLWRFEHESVYTVMAIKVRDTNSSREVDKHMAASYNNGASAYREEDEVNAAYLQTFQAD